MPKGVTVTGRFPVPLRRSVLAEAEMLQELESVKNVYGAINERMREWLLCGLRELEQRTQQAPATREDATSALVAAAREVTSSVAISQHFLAMYVQAKETVAAAAASNSKPSASRPPASPAAETPAADASSTLQEPEQAAAPRPNWAHLKGLVGD